MTRKFDRQINLPEFTIVRDQFLYKAHKNQILK